MTTRAASVLVLLVLPVLAAVSLAAPVPKGKEEPAYFPTKVGAKWVYRVKLFEKEMAEEVESVEAKDQEHIVSVRRIRDPKSAGVTDVLTGKYSVSPKGLVRVGQGERLPLNGPPLRLLKLPYQPGDKWEYADYAKNESTYVVGEAKEVETPAGKFKAIPVTRHWTQLRLPVETTDWYAPGVGLVKRVGKYGKIENEEVVLTSFTPGKD